MQSGTSVCRSLLNSRSGAGKGLPQKAPVWTPISASAFVHKGHSQQVMHACTVSAAGFALSPAKCSRFLSLHWSYTEAQAERTFGSSSRALSNPQEHWPGLKVWEALADFPLGRAVSDSSCSLFKDAVFQNLAANIK